ncbi:hypothetical protein AB0D67_38955 [Streptosporangium sp. NPDC048047]|uniref:hypothetical protein n=1 Tax=Streptosporangium sp. NPDC048047 TaxID=3155748 RepID=UPI0034459A59
MTDDVIHLIVRLEADGFRPYASSPQAPGLVYGRPTMEELHADLQDVLGFHFDRPGPFDVVEHHERHHEVAGGELVFRLAADGHARERKNVQTALSRALRDPLQAEGLVSAPANAVGEVVYICAVASDTIGWILAQLGPEGDTVNVAVRVVNVVVMA